MSPGCGSALFSCHDTASHVTWCAAEYAKNVSRSNSDGAPGAHCGELRLGPTVLAAGSTDLIACHATTYVRNQRPTVTVGRSDGLKRGQQVPFGSFHTSQ